MCCSPARRGRTRDHHPPALFRAFLHCYYKNVYGIRPVTRELQNTVVWLSCGFDRPPSRRGRSLPHRPRTRRRRGLRPTASSSRPPPPDDRTIDSTDVRTMPADQTRRKATIQPPKSTTTATAVRSSRPGKRSRLPRSSPRASKRRDGRRRCASRVTRSPSRNRSGCLRHALRHSAGTTTCWPRGRASRSVQRTKHRRSERHRVQGRSPHRRTQRGRSAEAIDARRDVQPPGGVERTNDAVRTAASGTFAPGRRPRTSTSVPRAVPSSRYCDHQRRTRRQSRKHRHHAMRTIL